MIVNRVRKLFFAFISGALDQFDKLDYRDDDHGQSHSYDIFGKANEFETENISQERHVYYCSCQYQRQHHRAEQVNVMSAKLEDRALLRPHVV